MTEVLGKGVQRHRENALDRANMPGAGIIGSLKDALIAAIELNSRIAQINCVLAGPAPQLGKPQLGNTPDVEPAGDDVASQLNRLHETLKDGHERVSHAFNALGI